MYYSSCILPVLVPMLFWAGYHYYHDRHLPEPPEHLLLALLLGVGSYYLGMFMYQALGLVNLRYDAYALAETNLPGLLAYAIFAIGLIEESAKLLPFLLIVIYFKEFNEPVDGIIYSSFIALGFAVTENLQYLQFLETGEAWARGFAGPVIHMAFASIWGYYVGKARLCGKPMGRIIIAALAASAILHGVYDFIVIALPSPALPISALVILYIWVWRLQLIRDLHTLEPGPCPPGIK